MNTYLTVKPAPKLNSQFYKKTAKNVGKALTSFLSSSNTALIEDDSDWSGFLGLEINLGKLETSGSKDKTPWIEAWDVPKIIDKMKPLGWKMSNINVKKKSLSIGFCKPLKKSNFA